MLDNRITGENPSPLHITRPLIKHRDRSKRLTHRIDVTNRQLPGPSQRQNGTLPPPRQRDHLPPTQILPPGKNPDDVIVSDPDQPIDQLTRQRGIGREPLQHIIHSRHRARIPSHSSRDFPL